METIHLKLLLLGDSNVGKSSFLNRYINDIYQYKHELTIGVDFGSKIIDINGTEFKLNIWDTAGQETFRSITTSYYRGSHCALIFFDLSNKQSFINTKMWIDTYLEYGKSNILLIGNKSDKNKAVTESEINALRTIYRCSYIHISTKHFNREQFEEKLKQFIENIDPNDYKVEYPQVNMDKEYKNNLCGICNIQ